MTPKVARMMEEVALNMLKYVRRTPFILAPGTGNKGAHQDSVWCAQFEYEVQTNEEAYWARKIQHYQGVETEG